MGKIKDEKEVLTENKEQLLDSSGNKEGTGGCSKQTLNNNEMSAEQIENKAKAETSKKSVGFWLGVVGVLVVVLQVICSYLNFNFDTKIIIELASFILAILVVFGVLKSNSKSKNLTQIKEEIKEQLAEKVEDFKGEEAQGQNKNAQTSDEEKTSGKGKKTK